MSLVHFDVLECFESKPMKDRLSHLTDEEVNRLDVALKDNKEAFTNRHTFEDNLYLSRTLTSQGWIPLPDADMVVPKAISVWDVSKPVGDQTTQMAWSANPPIPICTPHTYSNKKRHQYYESSKAPTQIRNYK